MTDGVIYGVPQNANSVLRIHPQDGVTLHGEFEDKWHGASVASDGTSVCVPSDADSVLCVQPPVVRSDYNNISNNDGKVETSKSNANQDDIQKDRENAIYRSGIATLRSSAHRVKYAPKNRKHDPQPRNKEGKLTKTPWLPPEIRKEEVFSFDGEMFDLVGAVRNLLRCCDSEIVGKFRDSDTPEQLLEDFVVPVPSTWRSVNGGQCESAQKYLSDQVAQNEDLLNMFDRLVQEAILPHLKKRLVSVGAVSDDEDSVTFYYQRPPTLRLQPGPGWASVKAHNDAEYGHQNGELNFWLPLTDFSKNNIHLWCESDYSVGDYHTIPAKVNQAVSFHGSSCRHYVNSNITQYTRMSLDFRVGVQGFFDPRWQMRGTTDDLGRKEFML